MTNSAPILPPDLEAAVAELERRRLARASLLDFTRHTYAGYTATWYHQRWAAKLNDFALGRIKRLMVFAPPRHGKSELVSRRLPAYIFGLNPDARIIAGSYAADLARQMGRAVQRIMDAPEYRTVFPATLLEGSNVRTVSGGRYLRNSDEFEIVGRRGFYKCSGVGGGITGRGFDFGIIDDPVKDAAEAWSETVRNAVWEWYTQVFLTRQEGNASILLTMCMTGDTRVLMADGTESLLRDIRPGDELASYSAGRIVPSRVQRWANQGSDSVFRIRTISGITVTANERHPFLVDRDGKLEWVRLRNLMPGDKMVRVLEGLGRESAVKLTDAKSPHDARGFARRTTPSGGGLLASDRHRSTRLVAGILDCDGITESALLNTRPCSPSSAASAQSAASRREKMCAPIGAANSALTTATKADASGACCAMTATSLLGTERPSASSWPPLDMYETTLDAIVEIAPAGREDVFDIQVEATENFIANGLVSHNTRWHHDDLAGRILAAEADRWDIVRFPALSDDYVGGALWPEKYDCAWLENQRQSIGPRSFEALYQQRPAVAGGGVWPVDKLAFWKERPHCDQIIQSWDFAAKETLDGSYTVGQVWGRRGATFYLLDQFRARTQFQGMLGGIQSMIAKWPTTASVLVEDKAAGQAVIEVLRARISGLIPVKPEGGKEVRAQAVDHLFHAGNVCVPDPDLHPWVREWVSEVEAFPNAANDDQVDAASQALVHLATARTGAFNAAQGALSALFG